MTMVTYNDPKEFMEKVESFLLHDEALNNLPYGVLTRLAQDYEGYKGEEPLLGYLEHEGEIQCVVMRTPPYNVILATNNQLTSSLIAELVDYFETNHIAVPGIIGERKSVEKFADAWGQKTGQTPNVHMEQKIFRLDHVEDVPMSKGEMIKASSDHKELVANWLRCFSEECNEPTLFKQADESAERFVAHQSLRLWMVDGQPVSMVNQSRPTKNGVTVSAVYTPDEHKRNGYASSCVAALSKELLEEGYRFCSLYTDLNNPTSNKIYKRIGYKEIGDSIVIEFHK